MQGERETLSDVVTDIANITKLHIFSSVLGSGTGVQLQLGRHGGQNWLVEGAGVSLHHPHHSC